MQPHIEVVKKTLYGQNINGFSFFFFRETERAEMKLIQIKWQYLMSVPLRLLSHLLAVVDAASTSFTVIQNHLDPSQYLTN